MNIFIYSDESGVFDRVHNDYFVFAGLIILGKENKDVLSRKYKSAEKVIRNKSEEYINKELKATFVSNKEKGKLFRSLNNCYKFSVVIQQKEVNPNIFNDKKDKQRYLDYAYKIAVKRAFQDLIGKHIIKSEEIERLYFYVDEHTTATDGRYELCEALEREFKIGTSNYEHNLFFPPIFKQLKEVELKYCDSKTKILIRAADIIANRVYHLATKSQFKEISQITNLHNIYLP